MNDKHVRIAQSAKNTKERANKKFHLNTLNLKSLGIPAYVWEIKVQKM
jgi:hypothetical protein